MERPTDTNQWSRHQGNTACYEIGNHAPAILPGIALVTFQTILHTTRRADAHSPGPMWSGSPCPYQGDTASPAGPPGCFQYPADWIDRTAVPCTEQQTGSSGSSCAISAPDDGDSPTIRIHVDRPV